jgi:hypothetical protein
MLSSSFILKLVNLFLIMHNLALFTVDVPSCFLQSLIHLISSLTILDLLKHLGINGIVDGVESHCIALLVGLVLVGEIIGINDSIVTLVHIPHLIID